MSAASRLTAPSSERDVPVLLGRQGLPLGAQQPQRADDLDAGLVRRDHRVDVAALGRDVGVGQRVLVLGDQLGPALGVVAVLGGLGELLAVAGC